MTRKDYVLIAEVFADANRSYDGARDVLTRDEIQNAKGTVMAVAERLASKLHKDNPRFDHARFINACQSV